MGPLGVFVFKTPSNLISTSVGKTGDALCLFSSSSPKLWHTGPLISISFNNKSPYIYLSRSTKDSNQFACAGPQMALNSTVTPHHHLLFIFILDVILTRTTLDYLQSPMRNNKKYIPLLDDLSYKDTISNSSNSV